MRQPKRQSPFQVLGKRLRFLRESRQESLAEVSGAVEIDSDALERIESGEERPSEDILMLLISHFGIQDHEAVQLWESAGYEPESTHENKTHNFPELQSKPTVVLLALDVRAIYSDGIVVNESNNGVVVSFTQSSGHDQSVPVARVGMSYDQAEEVVRTLQQSLLRHKYLNGPKGLPASQDFMEGNQENKEMR